MTTLFNKIFIIHRAQDKDRDIQPLILSLKGKYNSLEVIEPEPLDDDYSSLICFWSKKIEFRKPVISLYNTYMKLLKTIVDEKLDSVLILEDDAELDMTDHLEVSPDTGELINTEIELDMDADIHFLNTRRWKHRNVSCAANYYPLWMRTKRINDVLLQYRKIKKNKHRPIDLELDYAKYLYLLNFSYSNYFKHNHTYGSTLGNTYKQLADGSYKSTITVKKIDEEEPPTPPNSPID